MVTFWFSDQDSNLGCLCHIHYLLKCLNPPFLLPRAFVSYLCLYVCIYVCVLIWLLLGVHCRLWKAVSLSRSEWIFPTWSVSERQDKTIPKQESKESS